MSKKIPASEYMGYDKFIKDEPMSVLDKIRAEIEKLPSELTYDGRRMIRRARVYDIIDKYKAESEDGE